MLDVEAAQTLYLEALASHESQRPTLVTAMIAEELCAVCTLTGAWTQAYVYVYALQALSARAGTLCMHTGFHLACEVEALARAGELGRASEGVRSFGEHIGTNRRYRIPYLRALAVLAQFRGEVDAALAQLQEAVQLAEEMELPGELWSLLGALGEIYHKQGEERRAHQTFARAAQIIQFLANQMEDEQQRATFLLAQSVRHVLERVRLS